jgi:large subunit ribosomal protein L33
MAKKKGRMIVILECTEARALGKPVSRYVTTKNKTKTPGRLEKKKYNPNLQKHTLHKETK